ncbi:WecB/TagA/CpsF family glycosyltransferase [Thermaerobacter sp. PB12/4term]|nr:WecB/TagA/CpsF family glycosyltransferase [Thermaerobacter sp. PB12/4term]
MLHDRFYPLGRVPSLRIELLGLPLDALTFDETVRLIVDRIARGEPTMQVSLNAAKYVRAAEDPLLRGFIRRAHVVSPDGAGPLWAARRLGLEVPERVPGVDLMLALLPEAARHGWPVFLLGARPEVVERAAAEATRRWPGLQVAGTHHGYFRADEEAAVVEQVRQSGARLLFVALGSPRQERFLDRWFAKTGVTYAQGVGGGFDVLAGFARRAPEWIQRAGLEGVYRMILEPRKRWRRVVVDNARFIALVLRAARRRRGGETRPGPAP